MMNCIDLFSGAGGLTEGFTQSGYNILAHVEKEYPACLTLKTRIAYHYLKNIGNLDIYKNYVKGSISREELYSNIPQHLLNTVINQEINDDTINNIFDNLDNLIQNKKIDIIIGGPPCQAYSLVGRSRSKDKMENDERNYLYKQYLKFLEKYKPNIFVFENVRGLLTAQKSELLPKIIKEMENLGYTVDKQLLDAKDFGVPQSRKRLIIIGWKKEIKFSYPIFEKVNNNITINSLFRDLPSLNPGESVLFGELIKENESLINTNIYEDSWNLLTQHISRPHNERDLEIYKIAIEQKNKGNILKYDSNLIPQRLKTHKNLKSFLDRFKVVDGNSICHTMVAHISKDGHHYIHPDIKQIRSLSLREAARIQTFPDSYYFENSRTAAFTQIGNAVPPLMAKIIAEKIKETFKNY
ncbi:MAG: DNA cytosine methyltransferase [Cetobacterium sp.]|uniref:DNA cytosine methyltransferase n=1 Tax=Cetobacterium sp. TaxID=2071632 RepID=UPI002FCA57FF